MRSAAYLKILKRILIDRDDIMSNGQKQEQCLRELQDNLDRIETVTPEMIVNMIKWGCHRFQSLAPIARATVTRLIEAGAVIDAIFALQALELPRWKLRRIVYDNAEWHCSFSKQPELPIDLDDLAEAEHEDMAAAILGAFLEARRLNLTVEKVHSRSVPQVLPSYGKCLV